ncbi:hypothetical protein ANCCEY_13545 [Ancylostoma ceylanicum]|nr:hypothetical protein ANCCEY_13545 [Ancylostoma ceylanicum]
MSSHIPSSPIPEDRNYVEHSQSVLVVSDAGSAEGLAPLAPVQRRQRMNTVCGTGPHGSTEDPALLSPRPYDRKCGSMLSLDPAHPTPSKIGSVRRRHEEYTTITDSISIQRDARSMRQGRSHSTDHQESAPQSDDGAESQDERESRRKRSLDRRTIEDADHSRRIDEEELADCELTDVISDADDGELHLTEEEREEALRGSFDDSKGGIVFSVVNEEEFPHPSPRLPSPSSTS